MITINEPITIAKTQTIKFNDLYILGGNISQFRAIVNFVVLNEENKQIDTKQLIYDGEKYNQFWEDFNSGKFLFEELIAKEKLSVSIPDTIENDFVNQKMF